MPRSSFYRTGLVGLGAVLGGGVLAIAWGSLVACESLSNTSPLPDLDATSDFDAGYVPPPEEAGTGGPPPPSVDSGPPPASARIRLAHLIQGVDAIDLCTRQVPPTDSAPPTAPWVGENITKPGGLKFGEVSAHIFVPVADPQRGQRYMFKVVAFGAPCEGEGGAGIVTINPTPVPAPGTPPATTPAVPQTTAPTLRQASGLTLIATGTTAPDAGDVAPRGAALTDTITPPATALSFRVVHGVSDMPGFDVVINGETVLTGVRYGTSVPQPYTSPTGFATINAGIPENSTLTLRAGTTVKSFTIAERVRRGIAVTVFVSGTISGGVTASLCSDRSPPQGEELATCTKLDEAAE